MDAVDSVAEARPRPQFRKAPLDRLATLEVTADYCPQTLMRVLDLFARHAHVPYNIVMHRRSRSLHLLIRFEDVADASAERMREAAAAFPMVWTAKLRRALAAGGADPGRADQPLFADTQDRDR